MNAMNIKPATPRNILEAASIIKKGGVVIYPTETVYGIGCDPYNQKAADRVNTIKGRQGKPLPLVCSSLRRAQEHAQFSNTALKLADHFWPGPLMLILSTHRDFPLAVSQGMKSIGLRVPGSRISQQLAEHSGGCILSTSANKSGYQSAVTAFGAADQVGLMVDMILDDGPSPGGMASTIFDLSVPEPKLLREGPISLEDIKRVLG